MENVEIRPAYAWDCLQCGREVFTRAVVVEMNPEDEREMREEIFGDQEDPGCLVNIPEEVHCPYCGERFGIELYNNPDLS